MPKIITDPVTYCIRVTYGPDYSKNTLTAVTSLMYQLVNDSHVARAVCVNHLGKKKNNPHVHIVVDARWSDPTMRKIIKSFVQPNTFSMVKGDGDPKMYSYLFHECCKLPNHKDVPMCSCIHCHHKGWTEEGINKVKDDARMYTVCDSKYKMIQEVVHKYLNEEKDAGTHMHEVLFNLILDYYDDVWVPTRFQMDRYITTAQREITRLRGNTKEFRSMLYNWYTR